MHTYILALGSNLGDSQSILRDTLPLLCKNTGGKILALAPLFCTSPVGGVADRVFLNSALLLTCTLEPEVLLERIFIIEAFFGRKRLKRWENRILDVDILLWSSTHSESGIFQTASLSIPHPRMLERDFMLVPASLVSPDWIHPHTQTSLKSECQKREYHLGPPITDDLWNSLNPLSKYHLSTNDTQILITKGDY
jgi:2-amino-4-hydroxy-6-hydroxymethyldihydropteridine diphosphokinase